MTDFTDIPSQNWTVYLASDFDKFIEDKTGKAWSIQQSLLDQDSQAGNGVVNEFDAFYGPYHEESNEDVAKVEAWLKWTCPERWHFEGRYKCENQITTYEILTWLVYKGFLPEGVYRIQNYW